MFESVEDVVRAVIDGGSIWRDPSIRKDAVGFLRHAILEFLIEAETRAMEFGHSERAGRYLALQKEIEGLP